MTFWAIILKRLCAPHNYHRIDKRFMKFLTAYNRELVEERADTIEGAIINAISEIINERTLHTQSLSNVHNDPNVLFTNEDLKDVFITATDITELLKENYGWHDVTSRGVGRRLNNLCVFCFFSFPILTTPFYI